jgi:hypothetical protein
MRQRTAMVILGVALALVVAACGDSGGETTTTLPAAVPTTPTQTTVAATAPPVTETTVIVTTTTTTTVPVDPISTDDVITIGGLGDVRVGMTVEEAAAAAGLELTGEPDVNPDCYYVMPLGLEGVAFMVSAGTVARVDIAAGPITTRSGAGIGSTEDEIKELFPDQIEVSDHAYVEGNYLTFVPVDEGDDEYRVVFETDGEVVTQYRAGRLPEVEYIEGCS